MNRLLIFLFSVVFIAFSLIGCSKDVTEPKTASVELVEVAPVTEEKFTVRVRGFEGKVKNTGNVKVTNCRIEFYVYKTADKAEYREDFAGFSVDVGTLSEGSTYEFHQVNDTFQSDIEYYDYEIFYTEKNEILKGIIK